jgi:hypothetical protein
MAISNIYTLLAAKYAPHATAASLVPPLVAVDDWAKLARKFTLCYCAADAAASTDIERCLFTVTPNYTGGIRLFGAYILPDAAVATNGTNYSILQLGTRPQAGGGSQTAIGSTIDTSATSWVALSQITLYSSTTGTLCAQNVNITLARTHAGSGVVLPNMRVLLEFAEV